MQEQMLAPLLDLVQCLCVSVEERTGNPLCWCGLYPGGIPSFDYCGSCDGSSCGTGFVTVNGGSRYTRFGVPDITGSGCERPLQVTGTIGILRCFPYEDDGSLPPLETMTDISIDVLSDMLAIRFAADCCFTGDIILGEYSAIPVQGGCVGGAWQFVMGLG